MYYVYILRSKKDNDFYTGYTENLETRFKEHNKGLVKATRNRRPLELIYYEAYKNRKDAIKREKFLKTGWGRNYIRRVLANYLQECR